MKRSFAAYLAVVGLVAVALLAKPGAAHAYTNSRLMDDAVFNNVTTMSASDIQTFLNQFPNSCLKSYQAPLPSDWSTYGGNASAATIISWAATHWGVNPQVLLATLQKEENLVDGSSGCAQWQYNSAMGYNCPGSATYSYPAIGVTNTCVAKQTDVGFSAQVSHGAWQLEFSLQRSYGRTTWDGDDGVKYYGYMTQGNRARCGQLSGQCSSQDLQQIYYDGNATLSNGATFVENGATASLYTYTPYLNQSFPTIFQNWFGSTLSDFCNTGTSHPDASSQTNIIMVFGLDSSNGISCKLFNKGWLDWESLGSTFASAPSGVVISPGTVDLFAMGTGNDLQHIRFANGWQSWESLGGSLKSAPVAVSPSPGIIDVFARGSDDSLMHRRFDHTWQPWESLGGTLSDAPGAVVTSPGVIDVFVRGANNELYHRRLAGTWQPWEDVGGLIKSAPAAVSIQPGVIDVFARGNDDSLIHRRYANGWQSWESLGGTLTDAPGASSAGPGAMDVFARGTSNGLFHRRFANGWQPWESLGTTINSAPASVFF